MPSLDGILKTCAMSKNYYILATAFKFAWSARFLHRWRFLSKNLIYGQNVKLFFFVKKKGENVKKWHPYLKTMSVLKYLLFYPAVISTHITDGIQII